MAARLMFDAPVVDVRGLTKRYGARTVVDNASFEVRRGEVFALVGPNGSGKTTLIRMLCGLLTPTAGEARVLGYAIVKDATRLKQQIGYMSQRFSLYQDLSVVDNLKFYLRVYNVPRGSRAERLRELLAMSGLEGRERQPVAQLSGGWKQRLALACAIVHRPPLLFLDEPTAAVDPIARRRFFATIFSLVREGVTAFVTTHYLEEAEYANRVAMMQDGVLQAIASPSELRQDALRGLLLSLVCELPIAAVEILRNLAGVREATLYGQTIHTLIDPALQSAEGIRTALLQAGILVSSLTPVQPTLEDVFVSLYSGFVINPDGTKVELEPGRLRMMPLFDGLDEASLAVIANRFVTRREQAGQLLVRQGDLGDQFYVIVNGSVEVTRSEPGEPERQLAVLGRGDFFGEIALIRDQPRNASVRTLTPCLLLTLDRGSFLELLETRPQMRAYVERVAAERIGSR
jgi:ABC-2 type transport system ATP-binding protein